MNASQMTAVIIGPMQPHAIDALLASLRQATSLPDVALHAAAVPAAAEARPGSTTRVKAMVVAGPTACASSSASRMTGRRSVWERDARRLERGEAAAGLGSDGVVTDARQSGDLPIKVH
jgi:hypothetical protein